jgi:hypothetical protein
VRHEHEELRAQLDALSRAAFTPMPTVVPCPHCTHGSRTGPNGEHWRCYACAGTGRIMDYASADAERLEGMSETTTPQPQPEQPQPEADPTELEPDEQDRPDRERDRPDRQQQEPKQYRKPQRS